MSKRNKQVTLEKWSLQILLVCKRLLFTVSWHHCMYTKLLGSTGESIISQSQRRLANIEVYIKRTYHIHDKCSHFIPPGNTRWALVFPSSQRLSSWKGILKIFCKFTEHPCQSAISIKLLCKFIEITLRHRWSVNLLHIFTTPFRKNTFGGPADLCIKLCHFSGGSDQNTSHLFYFVLNPL